MQKKSKKQQKSKPAKVNEPVFQYTSICCSVQATKQPLVMSNEKGIGIFGSAPEGEGTLGKFRCSKCGKRCKCARTKAVKQETKNV